MRIFYTVPTTDTRNILQGNGSATSIDTTFVFLQASHLVVALYNSDDEAIDSAGNVTNAPLTITTDYTVSGGGDGTTPATGTVTLTFTPAEGQTVVVERIVPTTQLTRLPDGTPFRGSTQERQYDLLAMAIQQLRDALSRALLAPATFDPSGISGGSGFNGIVIPTPIDEHILVGRNDNSYELRALADIIAGSGYSLSSITIYNVDDTWEKPTDFQGFLIVEAVGGGAGGGGAAATSSSQAAVAGGGGAGAYAWARIADVDLADTVTVTVGEAGAGGGAGDVNGSAGEDSSFGAAVVAKGGSPGAGAAAVGGSNSNGTVEDGGTGGLASACTGDLTADGGDGTAGVVITDETGGGNHQGVVCQLGNGGGSVYGGAAKATINGTPATGKKYGGGGAGAANSSSQSARAGADGYDGVVIVYQFGGTPD